MTLALTELLVDDVNPLIGVERSADPLGVLLVLCAGLPATVRRRAPGRVLMAVAPPAAAVFLMQYPAGVLTLWVSYLAGWTASATDRRVAVRIGVAGAAIGAVALSRPPFGDAAPDALFGAIIGATPALIGDAFRVNRELARQARAHAFRLERLRDLEVERAVTEQRVSLARDLHDIVGHHLSAISLQAGGGLNRGRSDPGFALETLGTIRELARAALAQTKQMLGVLRDVPPELAPAPRLDDVEELVESARLAGVDVELKVEGIRRPLPDLIEACGFRIVQEALTNVVRHAQPAAATVTLRFDPARVRIDVRDDGRTGTATTGGGHGLLGMRERAALLGGSFAAGPDTAGGWRVAAELPVEVPA
jgi:signal transduction histidine kinase